MYLCFIQHLLDLFYILKNVLEKNRFYFYFSFCIFYLLARQSFEEQELIFHNIKWFLRSFFFEEQQKNCSDDELEIFLVDVANIFAFFIQ